MNITVCLIIIMVGIMLLIGLVSYCAGSRSRQQKRLLTLLSRAEHTLDEFQQGFFDYVNAKLEGFDVMTKRDDRRRIMRAGAGMLIRSAVIEHGRPLKFALMGTRGFWMGKGILFDHPVTVDNGTGKTFFFHGVIITKGVLKEKDRMSVFFNSGEILGLSVISAGPRIDVADGGKIYAGGLELLDLPVLEDEALLAVLDGCARPDSLIRKD